MQNYNQTSHMPLDDTSDIRDKLSTHVKKRILSSSSPVPQNQMTSSDVNSKPGKVSTKKLKKDPDSEASCGTTKDEEKGKNSDKHSHKPDILTAILNEKKMSLVRDPEVIAFLKKFNQELQRGRLHK